MCTKEWINWKEDNGSDEPHEGLSMNCLHKTQLYATDQIQRELDSESKCHADSVSQNQLLLQNLRAEQDTACQKMTEEIQVGKGRKQILQKELDQV